MPSADSGGESLSAKLAAAIALTGPMPLGQFMAAANAHYYAARDPLGAAGDFTTAPEISQMFGELIGACLADLWTRAGKPNAHYVELGPGRGTLAADALRSFAVAGLAPEVHLVETSPALRARQAAALPAAIWHDDLSSLPNEGALLIVANEFFDALPVFQLCKGAEHWHERVVAAQGDMFLPVAGKTVPQGVVPAALDDAPPGSIVESSPASVAIMRALAQRLAAQGGAMLAIDYGYLGPAIGDTLQAVRSHAYANPFEAPGEQDLTAHVDFATLAAGAALGGAEVHGPMSQRDFLNALGIAHRAAALSMRQPERSAEIAEALKRLTGSQEMGLLFKVLGATAPGWPKPAGFG